MWTANPVRRSDAAEEAGQEVLLQRVFPADHLVQGIDADEAQHRLHPAAAINEHHGGQWQGQIEKQLVPQRPGDVGDQHAGLVVLVDVWPVEDQPGQGLANELGAGVLEFPVLQIEHADKHD
ncbi:hypothetical protein D9M69_568790 [compost metagenome]